MRDSAACGLRSVGFRLGALLCAFRTFIGSREGVALR